jgi:sulfur relay (sulfurtransferase) DsrC/TusE family protein
VVWDDARTEYARSLYEEAPAKKYCKIWDCSSADSIAIVKFVKEFYTHIKKAMPVLMGHRYQKHIFGDFTNSLDKSVLDYDDEENTFVIKTLPVMNDEGLEELFRSAFKNSGNFQAGRQFSYSHCIVDLNPDPSEYNAKVPSDLADKVEFNLQNGQFPMKFASGVSANIDTYKTSNLVL